MIQIPLRCFIRTDDQIIPIDGPRSLKVLREACNCTTFDVVNLRNGLGQVMLVDDNGYEAECEDLGGGRFVMRPTRARKPVNRIATVLYHSVCMPGTTHQIVGDVAVILDSDDA